MIHKVLIADDDPLMRGFLSSALRSLHKEVKEAVNGKEAIDFLKKESFDLILTDVQMPMKSGKDVLLFAKKHQPDCPVIFITAHGSVEAAVESMKLGAFHYLLKPFSIEALESCIQKTEEHKKLIKENDFLKKELIQSKLIYESPQIRNLLEKLKKVSQSDASVFITGESGTGKEVIAEVIHSLSRRKEAPFIKVNCAAIPDTLVESEFFGHEKGAFTGAMNRKIGRFELADKGTLLLDEVTEIPSPLQAKLLRAIQEKEFERVGSSHPTQVNIRFLATSNRNMGKAISEKVFREDLYYRLNVVPIHIPPLRERKEDILPLIRYFMKKFSLESHKPLPVLDNANELLNYPWPGNVRELKNAVERATVLEEKIHIPSKFQSPPPTEITSLYESEKRLIQEALKKFSGNRTQASKALGISSRTLRNKLSEYNQ